MRLSALQRYILRECYQSPKGRISRQIFTKFYTKHEPPQSVTDSITQSLERLINNGLMIGYGRRTPDKWFIEEVRLTPAGRRAAKKTLGMQVQLPFRNT